MFPVLVRFPMPWGDPDTFFPVRVFGLLLVVAFLAGAWLAAYRARGRADVTRGNVFDLSFHVLAAGLVGARALFVLQHPERFEGRWLQVLAIWEQGLVWWGAAALATVAMLVWCRIGARRVLPVADLLAPGLALAISIGWVGSFCAGDQHGVRVTDDAGEWVSDAADAPAWAVRHPGPDESWRYEYSETPADFRAPYYVVPTQLLAAGAHLGLLALLLLVARSAWGRADGRLAGVFLAGHATVLFALEPLRADADRVTDVLGTTLTFTQAGAVPGAIVGVALLLRRAPIG